MRILPPVEEELRRVVRDARAADPLITVSGLETVLEKRFDRGFSRRYVAKLADKVLKESLIQADRTKLHERIHVTREKFRLASKPLLDIINWEPSPPEPDESFADWLKRVRPPKSEDVIEAAKNFAMLDLALLRAEIECGLYKDATAVPAGREQATITEEQRQSIVSAFGKWGYLQPGAVAKLTERSLTLYAGKNSANPSA